MEKTSYPVAKGLRAFCSRNQCFLQLFLGKVFFAWVGAGVFCFGWRVFLATVDGVFLRRRRCFLRLSWCFLFSATGTSVFCAGCGGRLVASCSGGAGAAAVLAGIFANG